MFEQLRGLYQECSYSLWQERGQKAAPAWQISLCTAITILIIFQNQFGCWVRGHQWEVSSDAENGTEDIYCDRCGESHHHQF